VYALFQRINQAVNIEHLDDTLDLPTGAEPNGRRGDSAEQSVSTNDMAE
jgi:hypothetical protein